MSIHGTRLSGSEAETRAIGLALGRVLRGGDVALLDGPLGAGKTTLVRAVAESMGLNAADVASPTFVLMHDYRRPEAATPERPDLVHVDAYRLRGGEDLESLGWDTVMERLAAGTAAVIVEWAERLGRGAFAGREAAHLRLEHAGEAERELSVELPESWRGRAGVEEVLNRRAMRCPVTGAMVSPECPTYPFASERARLADLYRWFSGGYQVSREMTADDFEG
jgi:tRNA threonylcarbamoyladenosine biosynthesis protein TsaE